MTRSVGSLGTVLVNDQGRTLYLFMPEKGGKVKCTGSCASVWPPLKASSGTPSASGGAHASMISTVADPSGGSIVTYNGWPLHTYASDSGPGVASGQGINGFGGLWYVISPSGSQVTKKASSSSSSSSGGYGGSGY